MNLLNLSKAKRYAEARESMDRMRDFSTRCGFHQYTQNLERFDTQWRMAKERENKPWPHASSYNTPLTFSKVEDVHALLDSYFSNLNFFSMGAAQKKGMSEEVMLKRADDWMGLMRSSMQNESNTLPVISKYLHDGCLYGSGFIFTPWLRDVRGMQTEHFVSDDAQLTGSEPGMLILDGALGDKLTRKPVKIQGKDGWRISLIDSDGETKDAKCWIDRSNPNRGDEPIVVVERDAIFYNAPAPKCIAPWNMLVPPDSGCLQTARNYWVREHMTYDEVAAMERSNMFNTLTKADLRKLKQEAKLEASSSSTDEMDTVDAARDADLGLTKIQSRAGKIEIFFEYCFEDVDGDGIPESIVRAVTDVRSPMLLMRHRIEYLYPHGRRPFADWHLFPFDHRYHGMGIPEVLEGTQNETDAFYQSRADLLELVTKPVAFYDPMSGLAPDILEIIPGSFIKARNPANAAVPFKFGVDPMSLFREQAASEGQAERAIGSTDMGLGRQSTRPNAPRTLGGTAIVVRQQQMRSDVFLRRAMYGTTERTGGIHEFLHQYRELEAALMPKTKEFRMMGSDELRSVNREDLQGRYDFIIDFGEGVNNPQLRMQNTILMYQNAIANPLIQRDPQALYHITIDMLEATGMKNASRILKPPQPMEDHPPMTQDEEFLIISKGIYIDPLPSDNHAEHLQQIAMMLQDQRRLATEFDPKEIPLLERHAAKHFEFLAAGAQALGVQGQQQLPAGTGGVNGPMGPAPLAATPEMGAQAEGVMT